MRYYFDTEFIEDGKTIDLISIGVVREDGAELYAINSNCDRSRASPWVIENVLTRLSDPRSSEWLPHNVIRDELAAFVGSDPNPSFWAYYCVAPQTRVLKTDLTWVPIGTVDVGDRLIAFDEECSVQRTRSSKWRRWREATVEAASKVRRPCYELTFEDGTEIVCSAEHRWLISGNDGARWQETRDMVPGAATGVVKPVDVWDTDRSYEGGYLAAAFDGEGFLTQKLGTPKSGSVAACRIGFSQKSNPMLRQVEAMLAQKKFRPTNSRNKGNEVYSLMIGERAEVLRLLGSTRPVRLLSKFDAGCLGAMWGPRVRLKRKDFVGLRTVVNMRTSTGTFLAEGLASHNCSYDWVSLCQLFGTMMDLPKNFPKFCMDLKQLVVMLGNPKLPKQVTPEHHALNDALWVKDVYEAIESIGRRHPRPTEPALVSSMLHAHLERLWAARG